MHEYIDALVWFAKDIAEGFRNARKQRELDQKIEAVRRELREEREAIGDHGRAA